MHLFSWVRTLAFTAGLFAAAPLHASCMGGMERYTKEFVAQAMAACESMPFEVGISYIDKHYLAFSTKDIQQPRSIFIRYGGMTTRQGQPLQSPKVAEKEAGKMARRTGCGVKDLKYSQTGPTLYTLVCSQSD